MEPGHTPQSQTCIPESSARRRDRHENLWQVANTVPSLPAPRAPLLVCACLEGWGGQLHPHETRYYTVRNIPREPTPKPKLIRDKDWLHQLRSATGNIVKAVVSPTAREWPARVQEVQ